jgi:ketosteroid isomerase-like protein
MMDKDDNLRVAQRFLELMGERASPEEIAALFSPDVRFEIPGDDGALPWIGRRSGRAAVVDFVSGLRMLTEPVRFEVRDVLASDSRAVILADLATTIRATGQTAVTSTAIVLDIVGDVIARFLMIEDSFEVSRAARGSTGTSKEATHG